MAHDIVMPNLGFDAQTASLVQWLKQPGETIQRGEAIAIIESDKADVELESITVGVVLELLFQPGEEVQIGAVIARVGSAEEFQQRFSPPAENTASPIAARIAQANTLDLAAIDGSGPHGRVMRQDVEQHIARRTHERVQLSALPKVRRALRQAGLTLEQVYEQTRRNPIQMRDVQDILAQQTRTAAAPVADAVPKRADALPAGAREIPITRMRQAIGRQLAESVRQAPHFYVSGEFDLEAVVQRIQTQPDAKINDVLQYFAVQTLLRVPVLNATYHDGRLLQYEGVHLAIAVALEGGLITPVLHDAQQYSLTDLATQSRALIQRARENRLRAEDLSGGTFTISNLGMVPQVEQFTAVINPPQVAILAVGSVKPRVVIQDGGLFLHQTVHCTLSGDHRVVDGMDLAHFMAAFQGEIDRFVLA
jgi:pyruvate dehydrogenase E2 component (dihydrolipoamide acetyltransferase)